ncbi:MAG: MFS transporter [Chloroflexota bacterium]
MSSDEDAGVPNGIELNTMKGRSPSSGVIVRAVRPRFHYAWVVAGITFLTLLCSAGFRSTPSILMVPLQHEFGWDRATISVAISINLILFGLSGPFAAALMQRFGVRQVMLCALVLIATGAALTTLMRSPWQLDLLWGVVVGTATGAMASVLAATVTNRWFLKKRGLMMGLLSASSATGQIQFLPVLAFLTGIAGWRSAALTVAGVALFLVLPVALLMKNRPEDIGLGRYGTTEMDSPPPASSNPIATSLRGLRLATRSGSFWLLAGSFFICGATTNGLIGTHLIPAAMDHGMSEVTAASLLAVMGIFDIVGTTFSGWLTDRLNSRWLLTWYYALRGLSLFVLPFALRSPGVALIVFVVFYGLDWVATVPPTAALTTDAFGRENGSIVYGWIFASHQFGAAFAAYGAGAVRTWMGDYLPAFIVGGVLCLLAAAFVLRIPSTEPTVRMPVIAHTAEVSIS